MSDSARWFAVYVRSRHEKRVYEVLIQNGVESFLPLVKTIRQWSDRRKKIFLPLFKGYVFVRIELCELFDVLEVDGVVRLVRFNREPAPIPDDQIIVIKRILTGNYDIETIPYMKEGQYVEVVAGPLRNMRGILLRKNSKRYFVVSIDILGRSISVRMDPHLLRSVQLEH